MRHIHYKNEQFYKTLTQLICIFDKLNVFQMKKNSVLILFASVFTFQACINSTTPNVITVDSTPESKIETVLLAEEAFAKVTIEGMTCAIGCAASIEKKLNATPGIQSATVSFESALAQIVFDPNWIQDQELSTVVQSVGPVYKVTKNERVDVFSDLKTD